MQKNVLRILSGLLVVVILPFVIVPAFAAGDFDGGSFGGGASRSDFFTWADGFGGGSFGGGAGRGDKDAYDDYVQTLPANGYTSTGGLLWSPDYSYLRAIFSIGSNRDYFCSHYGGSGSNISALGSYSYTCGCDGSGHFSLSLISDKSSRDLRALMYCFGGAAPVSGTYTLQSGPGFSVSYGSNGGELKQASSSFSSEKSVLYVQGTKISKELGVDIEYSISALTGSCALPVYSVVPSEAFSSNTYNTNTRPTSITGGNYGIVGDNGQITKVEDNSTIVNETNNTFYNPATGQTVPITNWSYDYSDRSYNVTTESGDTVTVTYGDENITIKEGDTTYNVYYLIQGSGEHTHDWRESGLVPASCLAPGVKTYTCASCQDTKHESTPALGHNWRISRTVTNQYDDDGLLIQEGYILYECERCGEQYRTTDTSVKPRPGDSGNTGSGSGTGSGTDPGGEEKETIWQKIGKFFGTIGEGVLGMIEAVFGKLLDGLISLAEMLMEKLKTVVETILSIFDELPQLFGGFLALLTALFPFLPPELMTILTFGVIAVVFIGIIKAVRG